MADVKLMLEKVLRVWRRYLPLFFFSYRENWQGAKSAPQRARVNKWDFIFWPVFKSENAQNFVSCLSKKPAQIDDALSVSIIDCLIGERHNISDTALRAAIRNSREGWLALWWLAAAISCDYLGACSLWPQGYNVHFLWKTHIISGDIAIWVCSVIYETPCT